VEEDRFRARFIWHEWADASVWEQAELLWLWSTPLSFENLIRALKRDLTILAPRGLIADQLAHWSGNVITYGTYLDALASISALLASRRNQQPAGHGASEFARLLATLAPRVTFHLPIGTST
jgi:hypothetical protein